MEIAKAPRTAIDRGGNFAIFVDIYAPEQQHGARFLHAAVVSAGACSKEHRYHRRRSCSLLRKGRFQRFCRIPSTCITNVELLGAAEMAAGCAEQ